MRRNPLPREAAAALDLILDALLTVAQIGAFFSILWLAWFIAWVLG